MASPDFSLAIGQVGELEPQWLSVFLTAVELDRVAALFRSEGKDCTKLAVVLRRTGQAVDRHPVANV